MTGNVIEMNHLKKHKRFIGNKTVHLMNMVELELSVPEFVALPSSLMEDLLKDASLRKEIAAEVADKIDAQAFAVRSSALIEDSENESFAGQFLTKTNVKKEHLSDAIHEVIAQAEQKLNGKTDKFSLIIQKYIDPEISGVVFTRNPNGSREMVIEYGHCEGENIVGGYIKPETLSFYWGETGVSLPNFFTNEHIESFKKLERAMNAPQDIEWCIQEGRLSFLQTRPITTISVQQYKQMIFLEEHLPKDRLFYFEKTEISEIAPRPTSLTLDLLKRIYASNGPVARVYKKFRVKYKDNDFLEIVGNELFVDKEKEIRGLLPGYSYLTDKRLKPRLAKPFYFLPTLKNLFHLNRISTRKFNDLFQRLKVNIGSNTGTVLNIGSCVERFLQEYELVFEVNLLSGLSLKKAEVYLTREPVTFATILEGSSLFTDLSSFSISPPLGVSGNSIELMDGTEFVAHDASRGKPSNELLKWWEALSPHKKTHLKRILEEAIMYSRLREYGRWLAMKNISRLKTLLLEFARNARFGDETNIFHCDLNDLLAGNIHEDSCIERKREYARGDEFAFPSLLTSFVVPVESKHLPVSAGLAEGTVIDEDGLRMGKMHNGKAILYTEMLTPDLTRYFKSITGIISNNGGLLSHLAIVAREQGIPVITRVSLSDSDFSLGDEVRMNGGTGEITKL